MSNIEVLDLSLADIIVPADRARDFDESNAQALAALIQSQGLFHPIRVRPDGGKYHLVSGLHRLRAFEINGAKRIPATVSGADSDDAARLEEVMENLGRGELIALDRCHHLYELKGAWLSLHPEAAAGGDRKSTKAQSLRFDPDGPQILGFAVTVADKIGLGVRTIEVAVKIWTDLSASSRLRLSGTGLATKQTELKALSEQKPAIQTKILDLILSDDHPEIKNVAGALAVLEGGTSATADEQAYTKARAIFSALPAPSLDRLVLENADRIVESLRRQGRI
ncbi:ParB/RepB/Spo0J family partition protein [Paenirhodobacter enshiensis]|uniref:ParB/RepB/Spo0J family partition protein n=1 Tax=Paenirhodobacter enshiensis TaxID=1105367 RepID=UPI0035B4B9D7